MFFSTGFYVYISSFILSGYPPIPITEHSTSSGRSRYARWPQLRPTSLTTTDFNGVTVRTQPKPSLPPYLNRMTASAYPCAGFVKLRYVCKHLHDAMWGDKNGNFKGKMVFFSTGRTLGGSWTPSCTISASPTPCCGRILRPPNRPTSSPNGTTRTTLVLFLLLNSRSSSLRLNVQATYYQFTILGMPDNTNTVLQIIGRLHRIGQLLVQYIWI